MKLTAGPVRDALAGLHPDTPIVFAETSDLPGLSVLAPIGEGDVDATLSYSWNGEDLDESGMSGEPAVVIWWKEANA